MFINKSTCPRCRRGGYTERPSDGDGRPSFTCSACGHEWSSGRNGGIYKLTYTGECAHRGNHIFDHSRDGFVCQCGRLTDLYGKEIKGKRKRA